MNLDAFDLEPDTRSSEPIPDALSVALDGAADAAPTTDLATAATSEPAGSELVPSTALVEVLGADVPLPDLVKWVPDSRLRAAAAEAVATALMVNVNTDEGLQRADEAVSLVRERQRAIKDHFEEPKRIAHLLHRRITGIEGEWLKPGEETLRTVGGWVAAEQLRRQRVADEARRQAQAEADRLAREQAEREAKEAAAAAAPAHVVEELTERAQTIAAPPVESVGAAAPSPRLSGSSVVVTFKARCAATTGDRNPNPDIVDMNAAERANVIELLKAIVEGAQPLQGIAVNWSYWNARAKADKSTLQVPGIVAFEVPGLRGRGGRR